MIPVTLGVQKFYAEIQAGKPRLHFQEKKNKA